MTQLSVKQRLVLTVLLFCILLTIAGRAWTQDTEREATFAGLAIAAEDTDKISRVMRTAAELTFPSIVHIETTMYKPRSVNATLDGIRQTAAQRIDETGTGIIVMIDDAFLVVTIVTSSEHRTGFRCVCSFMTVVNFHQSESLSTPISTSP